MKKRVVFDFDSASFQTLERLRIRGGHTTLGQTISNAIRVLATIEQQSRKGFSEVILRNPYTGSEMLYSIPRKLNMSLQVHFHG